MKEIRCKKLTNVKDVLKPEPDDSIFWHFGYDGRLYVMRQSNTPEPIRSDLAVFPNPRADNSSYTSAIVDIDWDNAVTGKTETIELGPIPVNAAMIRPLKDGLLVAGFRSFYDHGSNKGEDNACVFGTDGKLKYSMCLGDGISKLLTYPDRIIAAYLDEGIFGNYGWGDSEDSVPMGQAGIVVYSPQGEKLWEDPGNVDISDVYDLSYGDDGSFCCYVYPGFECVRTDRDYKQTVYSTDTEGCADFCYIPGPDAFLYSDGYENSGKYYLGRADGESIDEETEVVFIDEDGHPLDAGILNSMNGLTLYDASGDLYLVPAAEWE